MCEKTTNVPALFGKMVFGEQQMQQRLPLPPHTRNGSNAWPRERRWIVPPPARSPTP